MSTEKTETGQLQGLTVVYTIVLVGDGVVLTWQRRHGELHSLSRVIEIPHFCFRQARGFNPGRRGELRDGDSLGAPEVLDELEMVRDLLDFSLLEVLLKFCFLLLFVVVQVVQDDGHKEV